MRRRLARLGIVFGVSIGIVAVIPALTSSALAADCSSTSLSIAADCVSVPGVLTVASKPTQPTTTGCVQKDCLTVDRSGTKLHKQPAKGPGNSKPGPSGPTKQMSTPTAPRGAVLGIQLARFDRGPSDFYSGPFGNTLPFQPEGWQNGIYRNPLPAIAEAPAPSMWSGITAPAAFTSFVLGALLLVSAFSFKRLMLN